MNRRYYKEDGGYLFEYDSKRGQVLSIRKGDKIHYLQTSAENWEVPVYVQIDRLKKESAKFEATIKDQRDFKVTIERDTDGIVQKLRQAVIEELGLVNRYDVGGRLDQVQDFMDA